MPPRRRPAVSSAGGRLADPGAPSGPTRPPGIQAPGTPAPTGPMRPPGIQTPGTMAGGAPVGVHQEQPGQPQGIRGMANEQYRAALLRRAQGGASVNAPQQLIGAPPGPLGVSPLPGAGEPLQQGEGNPADLLQQLLRTRTSRRVLGGGGT